MFRMSAQYRPYRDEESVDGLEAAAWTDTEPGTIQIYEKTTEELPFGAVNKRTLWIQIALLILVGSLGFLLGFFATYHPASSHIETNCAITPPSSGVHFDHSDFNYEDSTIRDKILARIDGNNILAVLKTYQDTNRIPGSDMDHKFARYIQEAFSEFNFDRVTSTNYSYRIMLPKRASAVKLLSSDDKILYSNLDSESYPSEDARPFLPLSQANETILETNQLLYVNKGTKDDYIKLLSLGLNANETEGKVLIIRQTFYQAHDIVINAQEAGAKAVLLFPDPDLYGSSSPFPSQVQLPNDAGRSHPLAWTNYGDLALFNLSDAMGIDAMKLGLEKEGKEHIPVLPISYNTASKILRGLKGAAAPSDWNCFDFTLYLGPGYREENNEDRRDRIKIEFFNEETSITSSTITGLITGSLEPDRYVVIGGRRDSLNRGLLDSVSGTAVMLEIARVYSDLLKHGWRPRRTVIFNSFGAESFNLIGSSHWLETHQRLLHSRAVAYINCDLVVTGNQSISIAASPLLYQVLYNATRQVANPNLAESSPDAKTVYDAWRDAHHVSKTNEVLADLELERIFDEFDVLPRLHLSTAAITERNREEAAERIREAIEDGAGAAGKMLHEYRKSATVKTRPKIRRLDLQSIYSPFLLYGGIPVVDVRYAGFRGSNKPNGSIMDDMLPVLGTKYDNYNAVQHIDPHLKYHVAVAQVLSEILRDLSDSAFLPFNLIDYAITLKSSYNHFATQYGKTFNHTSLDLGKFPISINVLPL